jgi:tight adherence protein B
VFALGLRGGGEFDAEALQSLTGATGGQYAETADPAALGKLFENVQQALQNQYEITWDSSAQGVVDVTLTVGDAVATASAPVGGSSEGQATNQPEKVNPTTLPGFLSGAGGKVFIALLALVAAGLLAWGLLMIVVRTDEGSLQSVLRPYAEAPAEDDGAREQISIAESALIRRAVAMTAGLARDRGVLQILERKLEQADLPLRAPEALFFTLATAVLVVIVAGVFGGLVGMLLAVIVAALGPIGILNFLASHRRRKFASQLPDMLQLLAGSLRAGYSLLQGVDAVAQEVSDPMGQELRRVLAEARLGRPLEQALDEAADRMQSADFSWAVMAVGIQREVGGNLAELLDTVADTMIHRERLRREVKALTAEGRISAIILGLLPIGLGVFMWVVNHDYIAQLFEETMGQVMLGGSVVLAVAGFYWMKKIVEIEI